MNACGVHDRSVATTNGRTTQQHGVSRCRRRRRMRLSPGRTRKGRILAAVAAIAVGIAGLLLVAVSGTLAGDRALQRGVANLDATAQASP